ncbi:MAG: histidine phosphatase family protein [Bauldia sp.]
MPVRLTMICSGATAATRLASFPRDEPLDPRRVPKSSVRVPRATHILTAPEQRARQTAAALAATAIVEPSLRDCDYRAWAGKSLADVAKEQPKQFAAWLSDPAAAPHGGESLAVLFARVATFMDEALGGHGRTLAVTHAANMRAAVLHVFAAPFEAFWRIDVAPLSAIEFSSDGRRWTMRAPALPLTAGAADKRP